MQLLVFFIDKFKAHAFKKKFPVLKQAVKVMSHLSLDERGNLYLLSKQRQNILEIGSYIGASACCFGAALKEAGYGKVICVDTWNNDSMTEGCRDTWQEFHSNTESYKDYIVPVRGFSTDVVNEVATHVTLLDLLFIDGDHSYEGVKADWNTYRRFLRQGSIVVFHDSGWADGVKRVIEEDVIPLVSSFGCLPNMWWGTIK